MNIQKFASLGLQLNGALSSGKYDDISIVEVKSKILDNTIFDYLNNKLKDLLFFRIILTPEEKQELLDDWKYWAEAINEREDMLVERNGLCLLIAYLLQGILNQTASGN
jgi:hypothetical protein